VVFEKLVEVLVFGCAYHRIADELCSATTLRDRRDEWIKIGAMASLREIVLESYDRYIGLELSDVAVDCCIPSRRPNGSRDRTRRNFPASPSYTRKFASSRIHRRELH
jgi:hypothetical protein